MTAPEPNEYAAFSVPYVRLASQHDDVIYLLHSLKDSTYSFFTRLPDQAGEQAYAEGKWTVKQVLQHMIDTERIFAYRAYCFSRGEDKELPGFEQDDYIKAVNVENRSLQNLAEEFRTVRQSNLFFIDALTEEQIAIRGYVNGYTVTVRALIYMLAGHELYHLQMLKERYSVFA